MAQGTGKLASRCRLSAFCKISRAVGSRWMRFSASWQMNSNILINTSLHACYFPLNRKFPTFKISRSTCMVLPLAEIRSCVKVRQVLDMSKDKSSD